MPKQPQNPPRTATPAERHRADPKFARDVTRAEFGRFYWNDELAEEVRTDPHFLTLTDCFLSWNTKVGSGAV